MGAVYYQIPRAWRYEEDREHDAAFIKFKPLNDWYGKKEYLADKAGAQTPSFSLAKSGLHYQAFGYKNLSGLITLRFSFVAVKVVIFRKQRQIEGYRYRVVLFLVDLLADLFIMHLRKDLTEPKSEWLLNREKQKTGLLY